MVQFWLLAYDRNNMEISISEGVIGGRDKGRDRERYEERYKDELAIGDKILLYVTGDKKVKGSAKVVGEYYHDDSLLWPPQDGEVWPHRRKIQIEDTYEKDEEVDIADYYSKLRLMEDFKEKSMPAGSYFGLKIKGVTPRDLPSYDYHLLTNPLWENRFILSTDLSQNAQISSTYTFRKGVPGWQQLRNAEDRGRFVYFDDGAFFAKGRIGEVEKHTKNGATYFKVHLREYKEFEPLPLTLIQGRLSFVTDLSMVSRIRTIPASEYHTILQAAKDRIPATYYQQPALSRGDISFKGKRELIFPVDEGDRLKREIRGALNAGKHILFFGPPGTGKTEVARRVCKNLREQGKIEEFRLSTATADWTTFNTIGGYMPEEKEEQLTFNPGQFLRCFRDAQGNLCNEWLIIDELNRADIDKAFGQLFTVLTGQAVELPFAHPRTERLIKIAPLEQGGTRQVAQEEYYYVPVNWRILATINTYDKASLYEMSYAFMRRFAFIQVRAPKEKEIVGLMDAYLEAWGLQGEVPPEMIEKVEAIWKEINRTPETGIPRRIGPAIIRDLLRYLEAGGTLVQGLIAYVLPQFEGIRERAKKLDQLLSFFEGDEAAKLKHAAIDLLQIPNEQLEEA